MPKQYVQKWLIDMLDSGPYRDEREVKAEQVEIRRNGRAEVDKIWEQAQQKLAPPPVAPLPPPDWGKPAPPPPAPPSFQETAPSTPRETPPIAETDPGIGPVSRLAEPLPAPPPPIPVAPSLPAPAPDYWSAR